MLSLYFNTALPSLSYLSINIGDISAILLTIELYSSYSSLVRDTFSPKELTPFERVEYLSTNSPNSFLLSLKVFFCCSKDEVSSSTSFFNSDLLVYALSINEIKPLIATDNPIVIAILRAVVASSNPIVANFVLIRLPI